MRRLLATCGASVGAWRHGVRGAMLGGGIGWGIGWLLTPLRRLPVSLQEEEHYRRYPEEEIVDAMLEAGVALQSDGSEMDDLYREVSIEK